MTPTAPSASSPPSDPDARDPARRLRRMARLCAALVLAIITLSAWLRLARSGIGCADWPACYGAVWQAAAPALPAGAETSATVLAVRLAHRVLAVAALVLIVVMLASAWPPRRHGWRPALEAGALLAVTLGLAVLGALGAQSLLPAVALGNLLGGFAMLALSLRLASGRPIDAGTGARVWLWVAFGLVLLETALGGLASASGSLLACDGLTDCWAKAQDDPAWSALNPWHAPALGGGAGVQWAHRLGSWLVLLLAAPLAWRLRPHDRRGAAAVLACLLLQAALGPLMASAGYPMALVLAHNLLAAFTLALLARWL